MVYEGPLALTLPLNMPLDAEACIGMDVKLPDPRTLNTAVTAKFQHVLHSLLHAAYGTRANKVRRACCVMAQCFHLISPMFAPPAARGHTRCGVLVFASSCGMLAA